MKKRKSKLIMLILLLAGSGALFGQNNYVNHGSGIKTLGLKIGGTKYSPWGYIAPEFGVFLKDNLIMKNSLSFDKGIIGNTGYWDLTVNTSMGATILDFRNRVYLNMHGGVRAGLESSNNRLYGDKELHFLYGGYAAIDLEVFISRFAIFGEFQEFYTVGSPFGDLHWSLTFGTKINLY